MRVNGLSYSLLITLLDCSDRRWLVSGMKFFICGIWAWTMPLFFSSVYGQSPALRDLPKAPSPPSVKIPPRPTFIPPPPPRPFPTKGISPTRPSVPVSSLLQWTDFTFASPREKEFWDKIPDWSKLPPEGSESPLIPQRRRDLNGKALSKDESGGYTGYAKKLTLPGQRTIYQLQNGWVTRTMTWRKDGRKLEDGTYKVGRKDGLWVAYDDTGRIKSQVTYQAGQVVSLPQPTGKTAR